ncbi:MAG: ABC-2 family transporter protein [Candidatus Abawacabacteria bacterium]|nr:ABC-2 family transporter protein [Candidatus Abawacabacteria bacterium]
MIAASTAKPLVSKLFLRKKLAKYWALVRANINNSLVHIVPLFSRTGLVIMRVWVLSYLYLAIYQSSHTDIINGFTIPMVIWGVIFAQSFQAAARPPVAKVIEEEIKSGVIAYSISKPYSFLLFHLASFVGKTLPLLVVNIFIGCFVAWLLVGMISIPATTLLLATLTVILGYLIEFIIFLFIGLLAFWLEDITPILWNYNKAQLIFSGLIMPVAFFPEGLRTIVEYLPFTQIYYAPSRLLVNFDWVIFWHYTSIQLFWILFLGVGTYLFLRKAIKYVSINGG